MPSKKKKLRWKSLSTGKLGERRGKRSFSVWKIGGRWSWSGREGRKEGRAAAAISRKEEAREEEEAIDWW